MAEKTDLLGLRDYKRINKGLLEELEYLRGQVDYHNRRRLEVISALDTLLDQSEVIARLRDDILEAGHRGE